MKIVPVCLTMALAFFWAADGRAANDSDDSIAGARPFARIPDSGRLPNSPEKLSAKLPLNDFDLSGNQPRNLVRIAMELHYLDDRGISGSLPNNLTKLSGRQPEKPSDDDISQTSVKREIGISGRLPDSTLKIGGQYPTPGEH